MWCSVPRWGISWAVFWRARSDALDKSRHKTYLLPRVHLDLSADGRIWSTQSPLHIPHRVSNWSFLTPLLSTWEHSLMLSSSWADPKGWIIINTALGGFKEGDDGGNCRVVSSLPTTHLSRSVGRSVTHSQHEPWPWSDKWDTGQQQLWPSVALRQFRMLICFVGMMTLRGHLLAARLPDTAGV